MASSRKKRERLQEIDEQRGAISTRIRQLRSELRRCLEIIRQNEAEAALADRVVAINEEMATML